MQILCPLLPAEAGSEVPGRFPWTPPLPAWLFSSPGGRARVGGMITEAGGEGRPESSSSPGAGSPAGRAGSEPRLLSPAPELACSSSGAWNTNQLSTFELLLVGKETNNTKKPIPYPGEWREAFHFSAGQGRAGGRGQGQQSSGPWVVLHLQGWPWGHPCLWDCACRDDVVSPVGGSCNFLFDFQDCE